MALTLFTGCGSAPVPPESRASIQLTIAAISPASVPAGASDFQLRVTGSGFVSESIISGNGQPLPTVFVSTSELTATVSSALVASSGELIIAVLNPDGQSSTNGGNSGGSTALSVTNAVPTVSSLAPDTVIAGSTATEIVVTGTNFVAASTASFQGSARPVQFQNGTQLSLTLSAADLANPTSAAITVTNPGPGGGTSAPAVFNIAPVPTGAPVLQSISPPTILVGSSTPTLTLTGTNFVPQSEVLVGNTFQPVQYVSSTTLSTTLAYNHSSPNVLPVAVVNPDSGPSNTLLLSIVNPVPVLSSLNPSKVAAGAPDFLLQLTGDHFLDGTQVLVNGTPREVFIASPPSSLLVRISAADVAAVGSLDISVLNPSPGGGASDTSRLQILTASNRLRTVNLQANDLAWDAKQGLIYAAVGSRSANHPGSVTAIDPETGALTATQDLGSEPVQLSISSDQQYLYVSLPSANSVARLSLPGLKPDIQWTLGTDAAGLAYHALDLRAAPGLPHTLAVTRAVYTSGDSGGIVIYDDGQPRPKIAVDTADFGAMYRYIQWNSDATQLYASDIGTSTGVHLHTFAISSSGLDLIKDAAEVGLSRFFFDAVSSRFYDGGVAIDASSDKLLGTFSRPHLRDSLSGFAVDSPNHRLYNLVSPYPLGPNESGTEIQAFDLDRYTFINSMFVTSDSVGATTLIRWGSTGLALAGDQIYLVDGPFVTPGAVPSSDTGSYAIPTPALASINPETVPAGSATTSITVTGRDFTPATTLAWNGNQVSSVFVSPTEMQVTLPAANLAAPAAGPIVASNGPGTGASNALAFTVLPDLGSDLQISAMNLAGTDLVWNASQNVFYLAVTGDDPVNGNSIATVDAASTALRSVLPVDSEPSVLAISDDDRYLYAGFASNAVIQRYTLPSMAADLTIPLGVGRAPWEGPPGASQNCDFAVALQVAPGTAGTFAVSQGRAVEPSGCGSLAVFDDGIMRPQTASGYVGASDPDHDFSSIAWAGSQAIYAQSFAPDDPQDLYSLSVSPSGVAFEKLFLATPSLGYDLHFDAGTGYLYSDAGRITNPAGGSAIGYFQASGIMVPDSKLGRAFFLGQLPDDISANSYTLQIYDITNYKLLRSITIPNVIGHPMRIVRWGDSGVAFVTYDGNRSDNAPGQLYLLSGSGISGQGSSLAPSPAPAHVKLTWNPRLSRHRNKDEVPQR